MIRSVAGLGIGLLLMLSGAPTRAMAGPPMKARIVEGVGMAGVRLGQKVRVSARGRTQRLRGRVVGRWGPVSGFCFEGDLCGWNVTGGGRVLTLHDLRTRRVYGVFAEAPGWRTQSGIHPGSPVSAVRRTYPTLDRQTVCLGPAGREVDALVLTHRWALTLFVIGEDPSQVDEIIVVERARTGGC